MEDRGSVIVEASEAFNMLTCEYNRLKELNELYEKTLVDIEAQNKAYLEKISALKDESFGNFQKAESARFLRDE